jgi:hypothetical protein
MARQSQEIPSAQSAAERRASEERRTRTLRALLYGSLKPRRSRSAPRHRCGIRGRRLASIALACSGIADRHPVVRRCFFHLDGCSPTAPTRRTPSWRGCSMEGCTVCACENQPDLPGSHPPHRWLRARAPSGVSRSASCCTPCSSAMRRWSRTSIGCAIITYSGHES